MRNLEERTTTGHVLQLWGPWNESLLAELAAWSLLYFGVTEERDRTGNKWPAAAEHLAVCGPSPRSVRTGLAGGGGGDGSLPKGHGVSGGCLPVRLGPCQPAFGGDSEEESKQGDFQMVFACFLLCFPLEGEAATTGPVNLGLKPPG